MSLAAGSALHKETEIRTVTGVTGMTVFSGVCQNKVKHIESTTEKAEREVRRKLSDSRAQENGRSTQSS